MNTPPRIVYIVLSSRSLPYARICIRTLLNNCVEAVHLRLLVDDRGEQELLEREMQAIPVPARSRVEIIAKEEVSDRLLDRFPALEGLRQLHEGHPCWRKIIDPLVLSAPEDEMIVADPDLLFPNLFSFETTLRDGVMMMRQGPNCLVPPEAVRATFDLGVRLANHVDIGVAQVRAGAVELDWLDWLARSLDVPRFRPFMHIEAILWSALAMRIGGRHLDTNAWRCWERGKIKRLVVAFGMPGRWTLALEPLASLKCIHVSGPSKWWVAEAMESGNLKEFHNDRSVPSVGLAYRELTRERYEQEQRVKEFARRIGYYRVTKSD
jgi:hypothetical protein